MRICIFGAGAVGGHLAARLAATGHDVSVVARGAHLEAMKHRGVKLLHSDEVIAGSVRTEGIGVQDAVFVTLKANMLGVFADAAAPRPEDIRHAVWAKLVQNLGNASLCLLAETTTSGVTDDPALAELSRRMRQEATAIAAAHGIDIARAPSRPSGGHVSGAVGHRPSMLQDYERGRPMEIEAQLMAPLAFARKAGVPTPTLDMILPLAAHKAAAKGLYASSSNAATRFDDWVKGTDAALS